jgi:hypothetical protein
MCHVRVNIPAPLGELRCHVRHNTKSQTGGELMCHVRHNTKSQTGGELMCHVRNNTTSQTNVYSYMAPEFILVEQECLLLHDI